MQLIGWICDEQNGSVTEDQSMTGGRRAGLYFQPYISQQRSTLEHQSIGFFERTFFSLQVD
jgi:hypothetical protein